MAAPRPPVRADRPALIGGVSLGAVAGALSTLTLAWWPWPDALPLTDEAKPALFTVLSLLWSAALLAIGRVFEGSINWLRGTS